MALDGDGVGERPLLFSNGGTVAMALRAARSGIRIIDDTHTLDAMRTSNNFGLLSATAWKTITGWSVFSWVRLFITLRYLTGPFLLVLPS